MLRLIIFFVDTENQIECILFFILHKTHAYRLAFCAFFFDMRFLFIHSRCFFQYLPSRRGLIILKQNTDKLQIASSYNPYR